MDARDRLIAATQELLWERGYAATSPQAIQRAARAGQGSMYHHFDGKEGLAAAALDVTARSMREDAAALLDGNGTARERLARYLGRQRDVLRGCRMGRMTYDAEVLASPALLAPVAGALGWVTDAVADVVREGVAAGELPSGLDPHRTAAAIIAVVQGGYVLARAQQSIEPFDDAVAGALALLDAAIA